MVKKSTIFRDLKILCTVFLIWRVVLFLVAGVAVAQLPSRSGYEYTSVSYWSACPFFKNFPAVTSAANFDGVHYLIIASGNYAGEARFFPVFPRLIQFFADGINGLSSTRKGSAGSAGNVVITGITGSNLGITPQLFWIGLVLSNICFLATILLFYLLLQKDYAPKIAFWSTLFLIFFPTSFFFGSVYSESIFLFLTLLSFWAAREKNWLLAGVCGFLAAGTRLVGVFLFPALLFEFLHQEPILFHIQKPRDYEVMDVMQRIWPLFLVPVGLLSYIWFNYLKWGRWLYFLQSQGDLGNSRSVNMLVNPFQTLWRYVHILLVLSPHQYEWSVAAFELVVVLAGAFLLFKSWQEKIRPSYLIFAVFVFGLPIFSGTFTGMPRYVLVAFPIFVALGNMKNDRLKIVLFSFFAIALCVLTALFTRGYYVA